MIYGRITGVFVGIVTLSVTLAFATFLNQTAGPEWPIGSARLNGYNGMTRMPASRSRGSTATRSSSRAPRSTISCWRCWCSCYLGLRMLVNSRFGNVLVAIRENPERAELLGYDIAALPARRLRRRQHAGRPERRALHRLGPVHRAGRRWRLPAAAMPIIWVAVGGRKDLTATLIGTLFVLWLFQNLTVISQQYALILMGALLLVTVLFVPGG